MSYIETENIPGKTFSPEGVMLPSADTMLYDSWVSEPHLGVVIHKEPTVAQDSFFAPRSWTDEIDQEPSELGRFRTGWRRRRRPVRAIKRFIHTGKHGEGVVRRVFGRVPKGPRRGAIVQRVLGQRVVISPSVFRRLRHRLPAQAAIATVAQHAANEALKRHLHARARRGGARLSRWQRRREHKFRRLEYRRRQFMRLPIARRRRIIAAYRRRGKWPVWMHPVWKRHPRYRSAETAIRMLKRRPHRYRWEQRVKPEAARPWVARRFRGMSGLGQASALVTEAQVRALGRELLGKVFEGFDTANLEFLKLKEMITAKSPSYGQTQAGMYAFIKDYVGKPWVSWSNPILVQAKKAHNEINTWVLNAKRWIDEVGKYVDKVDPAGFARLGREFDSMNRKNVMLMEARLPSPAIAFTKTFGETFWDRTKRFGQGFVDVIERGGKALVTAGEIPFWVWVGGAGLLALVILRR